MVGEDAGPAANKDRTEERGQEIDETVYNKYMYEYEMDATASKVLRIVIEDESDVGAQCPQDFLMTGLKESKLREILSLLEVDGQSHTCVCRITQKKIKDIFRPID